PLLRAPEAEGGGGSAPGEGRLLRLREDLLACDRFDRRAEVAAIRLPTLVLQGGEDPLTPPRYGRFLAETIPGARLELVEGAGHFLQLEAPEACARAILAAVRPSPGASAARR
ncbi:MAG: alpha/beta fold hydrolase, partial [Clostridia bacterium]|nr:alpha/beta fold hydrolase [Clostridia bacterium]